MSKIGSALLTLVVSIMADARGDWIVDQNAKARVWVKAADARRKMRWSGARDAQGLASGSGTLQVFYEGKLVATYAGEMQAGRMDGHVSATYQKTRQRYDGEIMEWNENGRGTMRYADGTTKEGLWRDGDFAGEDAVPPVRPSPTAGADPELEEELKDADAELTQVYQRALKTVPRDAQEPLRRAERAWITFTEKSEAAFRSVAQKRGLPRELLLSSGLGEMRARIAQLRLISHPVPPSDRAKLADALRRADEDMTAIYRECTAIVDGLDKEQLVQAQRAWLVFRDAHTAAMQPFAGAGADLLAVTMITQRRGVELRDFYLRDVHEESAGDSFVTASKAMTPAQRKTAETFQQEAATLARTGLAARPWSTRIAAPGDLGPLPVEWSGNTTKLLERWTLVDSTLSDAALRIACLAEVQTVRAMLAFSHAAAALKSNDGVEARRLAADALSRDPAAPRAEHEPVWAALRDARTLLEQRASEAQPHRTKAAALAKSGKIADAIRAYQAAYEIFPDPAIPAAIQKLREESLGL